MWSGGFPTPVDPATRYKITQFEGEVTAAQNTVRTDDRGLQEAGLNWRQAGYSLQNERLTLAQEFQINQNNWGLANWFDERWKLDVNRDYVQGCLEASYQNAENGRRALGNWFLSCIEFASAVASKGGDGGVPRLRLGKFEAANYTRPIAARINEAWAMAARADAETKNLVAKAAGIDEKRGLSNVQNGEVVATRNDQRKKDGVILNEAEQKLAEANREV